MNVIEKFEYYSKPLHNGQDALKNHIFGNTYPIIDKNENVENYSQYDYVWVVDKSLKWYPTFTWYFKPAYDEEVQKHAFPYVYKESRTIKDWDSCVLTPTKKGNYKTKRHIYICAEYDPYYGKEKFDLFYVGKDEDNFSLCLSKNPNSQKVQNIQEAQSKSTTDLFWVVYDDTIVREKFAFSYKPDDWSLDCVHVFGNGEIDILDGIALIPKNYKFTQKELEYRFFANKKEVRILASDPIPYDKFTVNNYDDYIKATQDSTTNMFWGIPEDVEVAKDFDFSYYTPYQNKDTTHVFLNGENYDGIALFSKDSIVTEKEVEHRFYSRKNETEILASYPKQYEIYEIENYDDYKDAIKNSKQDLFWITYPEINVKENWKFDMNISFHDQFNRKINHVWKNGGYYDGVALMSKHAKVTEKEIKYRFFANKKEYVEVASTPDPYDIVFISYQEPNADENFEKLKQKFPRAKRVHGVKGIHQAHVEAAKKSKTDMFFVVDGDAEILDGFNFDYQVAWYDVDGKNTVYVWRSFNPVNNLVYGYGGVKLLPKDLTINMNTKSADMTTSISDKFKAISRMSNSTNFNTDPFNTWKSAFRECVKLSSRTISKQVDKETEFHLDAWCTKGEDKPFGKYSIQGAIQGKKFGLQNKNNSKELQKINDFVFLEELFKQSNQQVL